ncbi:MAG: ROK family transcriptional regulator [Terracidiphilus sp.]
MRRPVPLRLRSVPARPSDLRQANARGLLQLLQAHNPCSKADLVRYSGLSAPTVSSGIARLEELGLVERLGDGKSNGGRPPGMLRFNAKYGYVASADIGGTKLRMMLTDLDGSVMARWSVLLGVKQKTPEGVCGLITEGLETMCRQSQTPLQKVLRLVAGAPGITNVTEGVVLSAPNMEGWENVPLRALLEEQTKVSCSIENDTNLAALGEHWQGVAQGVDDFIFIALGTGVGAGIFLNGQLYHGAQWSAGEIGYFGVSGSERGPMRTREKGQLEQAIGGRGIQEEWLRALRAVGSQVEGELTSLKATQVFDLAKEGDSRAIEVLRFVARVLANMITDISLLLNLDMVVLGGGVGTHPSLCRETDNLVQRHEFARPALRSSGLGTEAQLYGAIALGLRQVEGQFLP